MICPTPDKRAWKRLREVQSWATRTGKAHPGSVLRPYRCQCGLWHLTSYERVG